MTKQLVPVALAAAKKRAAGLVAASDMKRFYANLRGMADARKSMHGQKAYIVNEVDMIEKDPEMATDKNQKQVLKAP